MAPNSDPTSTDRKPSRLTTSEHDVSEQNVALVRQMLESLEAQDLDTAMGLLDDDVVYSNVSLPTMRTRSAVERFFRRGDGVIGFRVHFHGIGTDHSDEGTVLTERIDALVFGPVHMQFWVYGRFEVRDGQITLWRDHFDWLDCTKGLVRGILGAFVPSLGRTWPT